MTITVEEGVVGVFQFPIDYAYALRIESKHVREKILTLTYRKLKIPPIAGIINLLKPRLSIGYH